MIIGDSEGQMDGFYAIYYTGVAGFGHAVLVLNSGAIAGADVTGSTYDGQYSVNNGGSVHAEIVLTIPAGTTLVTGQTLPSPFSQTIKVDLSPGFANGEPVPIQTPLGPVNGIFKKLRDLP